ncbi:phosphoadenosine phosphosulfate reductase [Pleurocapsa sp. PCC 7319]|uniref:phosphoadenosine phosphosulfate reductase n=1 Tax=Pleurocapsa sp. PCC 7319 TaxID=118161 RepID=UPI00047601C7|nr:phosphoadenosine phosphosulfate reductase [Pleurocapsa sp. PCC 7319]
MKTENLDLISLNQELTPLKAIEIVQWTQDNFSKGLVMSTSFGIQSAVMLHMVTQIIPDIPVIWIDTGYLPPETYRFAEELTKKLKLNLQIYQSDLSPARMEALYGKLWQQDDLKALNRYDYLRKVEPMNRALKELNAKAILAGLRREQTDFRQQLQTINLQGEQYKVLPILSWNAKNIYYYLQEYNLPYHPLFDQGYVTVGDWHSSRSLMAEDTNERLTRFRGLKQECGLHLPVAA